MRRRLVVSLAYGTSNSGAAYIIVYDEDDRQDVSDDIEVIRDWPRAGANRDASEKVPSDIVYDNNGRPIGYGFDASKHDATVLQWVKLLLEPSSFRERSNRTSRIWHAYYALDSKALQKRPVDVVGDYLRWLWRRVKAAIIERESEDEDTELFEPANLTVVLTVPASWSAPAKQRMATAAVIAGIPEQCIKTLSEPEAAAVYSLKKKARQRQVVDGDCVIVVDAGGGTVDAVAYRVRTREPLTIEQVTLSKGDFCGSSFVNKEFKSQLQSILGDKFNVLSERANERIAEEFEYNIKRGYNPFDSQAAASSYIPVDGLEDDSGLGIRNGKMKVEDAVIFAAFDSVMTQIMNLIDSQRAELRRLGLYDKLSGILLVGGFGKSGFLRTRIRQEFPARSDPKVWASDDAWTAVVRGAVACEASAKGRQALIHSRLSSYNYGIPFVHYGKRKVHWLVHKGQSIQSNMSTEPYGLRIDDQPWLDDDETCLVIVPIVASSDDDPNDEHTEAVTPHAEIQCRVPTALRFASRSKEIQVLPSKAWHIPATLVLYFDGALISFRCKIDDQEVGVAEVTYFRDGLDCTTEEDLISEPGSPLVEKNEKHARADSKVSFVTNSSSDEKIPRMPPELRHSSAPAALAMGKETAPSISPSTSSSASALPKKDAKKHFFTIRTKRDTSREHRRFLAPSPLNNLPVDERLRYVYGKKWATVSDVRKGAQ